MTCVSTCSFLLLQTLAGSLTFSDTSLSHSGTFATTGPSADVVLKNYYSSSSSSSYHNDANVLDLLPGSSFSLFEGATLRNEANSRNGQFGLIRIHGDVLSVDGSATRLESAYGSIEFVEPTVVPQFSVFLVSGGELRFMSSVPDTRLQFSGLVLLQGGHLRTAAAMELSGAIEITSDNSYLRGTGDVVVSGPLLWTKGRMDGSGTTTITGTLQLEPPSATAYVYLQDTRALVNNGA
jgi:hypothetical protein